MRLPLIRIGKDERPIQPWEWCLSPLVYAIVIPALLVMAVLSIPYFGVYPERHLHELDLGTEREQELMRRYRQYASRVSFWKRLRTKWKLSGPRSRKYGVKRNDAA